MKIHQKQFIISTKQHLIDDTWQYLHVGRIVVSFSEDLPVKTLSGKNGNIALLLGWPVPLFKHVNWESLDIDDPSEIADYSQKWAGRWCLVCKDQIMTDAGNLICLVYNNNLETIASSPALMYYTRTGKNAEAYKVSEIIENKGYHNWYLLPRTGFSDISKVFPGQKLEYIEALKCFKIVYRKLELNLTTEYEYLFQQLKDSLENELIFFAEELNLNIYIALSSGFDSRLILGMVSHLGLSHNTYTHLFPSMKISDYKFPRILSSQNIYIKPKKRSEIHRKAYAEHSGGHSVDADKYFFEHQQWDSFTPMDVCIRGGMLELCGSSSAHLYDRLPNLDFSNKEDSKAFSFAMMTLEPSQMKAVEEYFEYGVNHPLNTDFNKRYYLDQRIGGWLSYIEQSLTITNTYSHHIGNSIYQINLMKNLPESIKKTKGFHLDYLHRYASHLLDVPFNFNSKLDKVKMFINRKIDFLLFN